MKLHLFSPLLCEITALRFIHVITFCMIFIDQVNNWLIKVILLDFLIFAGKCLPLISYTLGFNNNTFYL